ncbi:MAG: hypothetical protein WCL32_01730 [Planctomycetota bacterium]|jgi:hypothetical protein
MSHKHDHPHHSHESKSSWWKQPHRDWRVWVGIVLMIAAMAAYVLSFDESMRPGGVVKETVPAAP